MSQSIQYSASDLSRMARRVHPIGVSIFSEMSRLAAEHNAVNLSQGFPDFPAPEVLKQAKLGGQEEKLNRLLQELAWEAIKQHPLSGVRPDAR